MDFALSPDWPALWCYFIILAIGFVVATVQINRLFPGFPQAWIMMSNWVLFAVFLLLPILLFWFLDRCTTPRCSGPFWWRWPTARFLRETWRRSMFPDKCPRFGTAC